MVLAYQLLFIILVIGSSFFGLRAFFITVISSLLFTMANVFTLPLLMLQSTVILGAGAIGLIIATIVSLCKSGQRLIEYKERMDFKSIRNAIIYVIFVFIGLWVYRRVYMYTYYMYSGSLYDLFTFILFIAKLYFIFVVPSKISDKFKLESGGFGCIFIGIAMVYILRNMGLLFI